MATAAAPADLYADLRLTEDLRPTRDTRADRDKGVVKNVRVLGRFSENGREYTRECMADAVRRGLYEDAPVWPNHGRRSRGVEEVCGRLRGVHLVEGPDGPELRARELVCSRVHPLYERLMEAAEDPARNDFLGLSHEAEPDKTSRRGDTLIVHRLKRVEGVAVVHDPATTNGLHEGRTAMTAKLREWVDAQACNQKLGRDHRKRLLLLSESLPAAVAEQELDMPAEPPPADTGEGDPMTMLAKAAALLASSGDADQHELGMKILKLLKPEAPAETPSEPPAEGKEGDESRKHRAAYLLSEQAARDLCAGAGAPAGLAAACAGLTVEKALVVLRESKAAQPAPAPRVRSQEAGAGTPAGNGKRLDESKVPDGDAKAVGAWLRGKD